MDQAVLPTYTPMQLPTGQVPMSIDPGNLLDGTIPGIGQGPYKLPLERGKVIGRLFIQNLAIVPLNYRIVKVDEVNATASAAEFNGVLPAGSAQDDGLGGQLDLSLVKGDVYLFAQSGNIRATRMISYLS